jgi:hypothetical protein
MIAESSETIRYTFWPFDFFLGLNKYGWIYSPANMETYLLTINNKIIQINNIFNIFKCKTIERKHLK